VSIDTDLLKEARILLVGSDPARLSDVQRVLTSEDYAEVQLVGPEEAVARCRRLRPDLVLIDLEADEGSGLGSLEEMHRARGDDFELPAVLGMAGPEAEDAGRQAREWGVHDFLRPGSGPLEISARVWNCLENRELREELERRSGWLEKKAYQRSNRVENAQVGILQVLARLVEYRDYETEQHGENVGALAARIAREIGLPEEDVAWIRDAAPLHDIGMVVVPDRILLKRDELDEEERKIMMTHAANGARILAGSDLPVLQLAREIALTHHERWDGEGYPRELARTEIPLSGRIVAVADAFEAITHDRPFRDAETVESALEEIESERERQFDPRIVDALLAIMEEEEGAGRAEPAGSTVDA